jgi:hypothetical protein
MKNANPTRFGPHDIYRTFFNHRPLSHAEEREHCPGLGSLHDGLEHRVARPQRS